MPYPRPIDIVLTALIRLRDPDYKPRTRDQHSNDQNSDQDQDKALATDFGLEASTFSNYKLAKRKPEDSKKRPILTNMARAWAKQLGHLVGSQELQDRLTKNGFNPNAAESITALTNEFKSHLKVATLPTAYSSLIHDVINTKGGRLQISSLDYGIFAGTEKSFFEGLTTRYLNQLGIKPQFSLRNSRAEESLRTGETHLAMCYFASVSRILSERFFSTPIRISLGAVSHDRYSSRANDIARALYVGEWIRGEDRVKLRPIVVRNEVGYLHCRHFLQDNDMVILEQFDAKALRNTLINEANKAASDADAAIPVVIVDEFTALHIFSTLGTTGLFAVPISTANTNFTSHHRRELPQYFMSWACSRREKDFWEFLQESFGLFLSTEVNTTSRLLADTFWRLEGEVFRATEHLGEWRLDDRSLDIYNARRLKDYERRLLAREYALYTLSLDRTTVAHPSTHPKWQEILRRTRKMIMEEMVGEDDADSKPSNETRAFIRSVLSLDVEPNAQASKVGEQQLVTQQQLDLLKRYTDQELDINKCRGYYERELIAMIRMVGLRTDANGESRATGSQADELEGDIEVMQIDPAEFNWDSRKTVEIANGVTELLSQLGEMYSKLRDPVGTKEEQKDIGITIKRRIGDELLGRFKRYARILLAVANTRTVTGHTARHPAGIVCILHQPGFEEPLRTSGAAIGHNGSDKPRPVFLSEMDRLSCSCELRYLWVAERYRRRNISQLLLGRAVRWCRQQSAPKYEFVRVAILPQLEVAIEHFRQVGFRNTTELEYDKNCAPQRLIFELKL
jgi:GNAT superfamily N-acetyltransferase